MKKPSPERKDDSRGFPCRAPAVMLLLAVCLVLWLLGAGLGTQDLLATFRLDAARPTLESFLTSHLFHKGGLHLSVTLVLLLFAGGILETRWGTPRFVTFYLMTAWGTAGVSLLAGIAVPQAGTYSCGATAVALGALVGVGFLYPEHRLVRVVPPAKHLVWIIVFLAGAALISLSALDDGKGYFLLPQVSGVAFALLFLYLDPWWARRVERWKARREAGRRKKVVEIRHRVERLLEKISAEGYESLSRDEKLFLRQASKHYRSQ